MWKTILVLEGRIDKTDWSCRILGKFMSSTPFLSKKILRIFVGALLLDLMGVGLKIIDSIISNAAQSLCKNISPSPFLFNNSLSSAADFFKANVFILPVLGERIYVYITKDKPVVYLH